MEDNIEINDYVRTNLGHIGKIIKEYTFKNGEVVYPEPQEYVLDNGYVLNEAGMYQMGENILKHSSNLIDLIEVGDYINGEEIDFISISKEGKKRPLIRDNIYFFDKYNSINSIVTKEQFTNIEYKIG